MALGKILIVAISLNESLDEAARQQYVLHLELLTTTFFGMLEAFLLSSKIH